MITLGIAVCHAFGTSGKFRPELLYLGALVTDYHIVVAVAALL